MLSSSVYLRWFASCTDLGSKTIPGEMHAFTPDDVKPSTMLRTAANVVDRPSKRAPREEAPRLELPLELPEEREFVPSEEQDAPAQEPERGFAIIDFYI